MIKHHQENFLAWPFFSCHPNILLRYMHKLSYWRLMDRLSGCHWRTFWFVSVVFRLFILLSRKTWIWGFYPFLILEHKHAFSKELETRREIEIFPKIVWLLCIFKFWNWSAKNMARFSVGQPVQSGFGELSL